MELHIKLVGPLMAVVIYCQLQLFVVCASGKEVNSIIHRGQECYQQAASPWIPLSLGTYIKWPNVGQRVNPGSSCRFFE